MANEVTINIESSLAAMAFVVADQQEQIKTLREMCKEWEKMYHDEQSISSTHAVTIGVLEDETKELKDKLHESEQDAKNFKDNVDILYEEKVELCNQLTEVKNKILEWHEIDDYVDSLTDYPLSLTVDDYPFQPFIILKCKQVKEGCYDNRSNMIPVGTQSIAYAYLSIMDGKYTFNYKDSYTKVIAWCMVSDKNF